MFAGSELARALCMLWFQACSPEWSSGAYAGNHSIATRRPNRSASGWARDLRTFQRSKVSVIVRPPRRALLSPGQSSSLHRPTASQSLLRALRLVAAQAPLQPPHSRWVVRDRKLHFDELGDPWQRSQLGLPSVLGGPLAPEELGLVDLFPAVDSPEVLSEDLI